MTFRLFFGREEPSRPGRTSNGLQGLPRFQPIAYRAFEARHGVFEIVSGEFQPDIDLTLRFDSIQCEIDFTEIEEDRVAQISLNLKSNPIAIEGNCFLPAKGRHFDGDILAGPQICHIRTSSR
ncbi:MAG: hypothetical protein R3C97_13920 [Geminicoccaceae bacterium]